MIFKVNKFVPDAKIVSIYTYIICDSNGNILSNPSLEFLNKLNKESPNDAEIIVSQIKQVANLYGLMGRDEANYSRQGLWALPSKYDEDAQGRIDSRYRMYYWVIDSENILIGGGCLKPHKIKDKIIKSYQEVPECESSAKELSEVSNYIEQLNNKEGIFIDEIDKDEIFTL